VLTIVSVRHYRRRRATRAGEPDQTGRERIDELKEAASRRAVVEGYSADAEELTRRLAAILDNKAARLEVLIERADEAVARLEGARVARVGSGLSRSGPGPDAGGATVVRHADPQPAEGSNPVHDRVEALSQSGMPPVEIARETGLPVGQVELILALRRAG